MTNYETTSLALSLISAPDILVQRPYTHKIDCWAAGVVVFILCVSQCFLLLTLQAVWLATLLP